MTHINKVTTQTKTGPTTHQIKMTNGWPTRTTTNGTQYNTQQEAEQAATEAKSVMPHWDIVTVQIDQHDLRTL